MNGYSLKRHRHEVGEIGRMYLLVVVLFLAGLVVWQVGQFQGAPWEGRAAANPSPSQHYGRQ